MFAASVYQQRRAALCRQLERGLILLFGHQESPINCQDNTYPFRQDSNFLYYVGLPAPGVAALIDVEAGAATLFADEASLDHLIWMGARPSVSEWRESAGMEAAAPLGDLDSRLRAAIAQGRAIHYLPPYRAATVITLHRFLGIPLEAVARRASVELIRAVVAQRSIKTQAEIAEMEKAVNISRAMHLMAMRTARPGMKERQVVAVAEAAAREAGGRVAYQSIVTIDGHILHNHHYDNTLKKGRLLLADCGAETSMGYAGDITRTFPVSGAFTSRQKEIYQVVLDAQRAALAAIAPGGSYRSVHSRAAEVLADGLRALGLLRGDTAEIVANGAHALFFPHGLGHMIGMDVHDMEDLGEDHVGYDETYRRSEQFGLRSLRFARELRPGFTLTVEPGVYFIPELMRRWRSERRHERFINYERANDYLDFGGVRIEDNIVVDEQGCRVLGDPIPKEVEEVESVAMEL
jgi:Xaa-Pro aminopeptidase